MILTDELANAIVDRAMAIIHHNVNVISVDGIIIASGDKSRIGSIHEVGLEVARQGRTISIYDEDLALPEARKSHYAAGINTPIIVDGKTIFVVGVSGNPNEISRYAALAVMTAELLARQAIQNREINWSTRLNDMVLLRCLRNGEVLDPAAVEYLSALYDFSLKRVPYLVKLKSLSDESTNMVAAGRCMQEILNRLNLDFDVGQVSLLEPDLMFLLAPSYAKELPYLHDIQEICERNAMELTVVKGFPASDLTSLVKSLRFAHYCLDTAKASLDCTNSAGVFATVMRNQNYQYLLQYIRSKLSSNKLAAALQQTVNVYMQHNLEQQSTAAALNVHRNTLKNRFKIIKELTGLDPDRMDDLMLLYLAFHDESRELMPLSAQEEPGADSQGG